MKPIRQYICNIRFAIAVAICIIVLGAIGYFVFSNGNQTVAEDKKGNEQAEEHGFSTQKTPETTTEVENITTPIPTIPPFIQWQNNEEIKILRDYLRIPTVHPDIIYKDCVYFLEDLAAPLNLSVKIHHPVDDKNPVVVMTWEGSQTDLPSIVLNSHMDVVPVFEEYWTHPPFGAEMNENGDIFARGAQDMKSIGMLYLAAIRALKSDGIERLKRTVHVVFVPDEELGGARGMAGFVTTDEFKQLNVSFLLDEGRPIESDGPIQVFTGERTIWQIQINFHGHSGHGSLLFEDTPGEKLSYVVDKFMRFRKEESRKLKEMNGTYGNVTTINLTVLKGGVENNVIPANFIAIFDCRISVNTDLDEFERQINEWCKEAGPNITIEYLVRGEKERITSTDDSNPFWKAFKQATDELSIQTVPTIRSGGSDSRFVRRLGIPALGFSPLPNTKPLLHDHDEYINAEIYLKGIDIYKKIITNLGNV